MRKRRTRKEKIIANLHRQLNKPVVSKTQAYEVPQRKENTITLPKITTMPGSPITKYPVSLHVALDLKKSMLLTMAIIFFEVVLFFILQKRIFGLSYMGF